jgi:hypothetical protein
MSKHWRFYHFTSEKHLKAAKKYGVTEGVLPLQLVPDKTDVRKNVLRWMANVQWLTKNPEFIPMDAPFGPPRSSLLGGRKGEYRITVDIPKGFREMVRPWPEIARELRALDPHRLDVIPLSEMMEKEINIDLQKPDEWWLFKGVILPTFFRKIDKNPSLPPDEAVIQTADSYRPLEGIEGVVPLTPNATV